MANWIQTWNGGVANLDSPLAVISVSEIAHVLSQLCRFGGHTKQFYSVAQHSVLVYEIFISYNKYAKHGLQLAALFHDAHEAYWGFGDVATPAKNLNPKFFERFSRLWDKLIAEHFGFYSMFFQDSGIKGADQVALATEKRDLMDHCEIPWCKGVEPYHEKIIALKPQAAMDLFMDTYIKINQNAQR